MFLTSLTCVTSARFRFPVLPLEKVRISGVWVLVSGREGMDRVCCLQVFKPHRNAVRNKVTFVSPLQSTTCKTSTTQQKYTCAQLIRSLENSTHLYIYWWVYWNIWKKQNQSNSGVRACNPSLRSVTAEPTASNPSSQGSSTHDFGVLSVGAPVGTGDREAIAVGPGTLSLQQLTYSKTCPPVCNGRAQDTYNTQHGGGDCTTLLPSCFPILLPEQSLCLRGSQTRGKAHHPHDTAAPTEAKQ